MREQIDGLRRERVIFDNVYKRLERELLSRRKEMANVIEIANSAYEERDRAQEKLALMMKKAERDRAIEIQSHLNIMGEEEKERIHNEEVKSRLQAEAAAAAMLAR